MDDHIYERDVVSDSDKVTPKFKKDGTLKFAKVVINEKPYKLKGTALQYNDVLSVITFNDPDVIGSYKVQK